ncbi:hypothetical protein FMEAI12_2470014 [Parafrankia sp. Ea1.12]|nr:hypothetical protein FMEAI12_2470014 [Parafrankia sp. Ea1.12]
MRGCRPGPGGLGPGRAETAAPPRRRAGVTLWYALGPQIGRDVLIRGGW